MMVDSTVLESSLAEFGEFYVIRILSFGGITVDIQSKAWGNWGTERFMGDIRSHNMCQSGLLDFKFTQPREQAADFCSNLLRSYCAFALNVGCGGGRSPKNWEWFSPEMFRDANSGHISFIPPGLWLCLRLYIWARVGRVTETFDGQRKTCWVSSFPSVQRLGTYSRGHGRLSSYKTSSLLLNLHYLLCLLPCRGPS